MLCLMFSLGVRDFKSSNGLIYHFPSLLLASLSAPSQRDSSCSYFSWNSFYFTDDLVERGKVWSRGVIYNLIIASLSFCVPASQAITFTNIYILLLLCLSAASSISFLKVLSYWLVFFFFRKFCFALFCFSPLTDIERLERAEVEKVSFPQLIVTK